MCWRQEKNILIRKSAEAFIYSVFFFTCANLTRRALLIKYSIKLYFSKERRGAYCFLMPRLFGVALFRLNAIGYCVFRKSAAAVFFVVVFVRFVLSGAFCRGYTVWIVFAGLLHLPSVCITFECIIAFVVNFYYICGLYYICGQLWHLWLQHGLLSYLLTDLTTDPPTYYRSTHLPSYPDQKEAYLLKQELNLYQIINYNSHELILAAGRVSE